jgi:hypothetical protein
VGEYPVREVLRGAALSYATETRLVAVEPDGANPREVLSVAADMDIQDFDVSPDGSTIVLTVGWVAAGEFRSRLLFLDSQTGAELNRLDDTDSALETFTGSLYSVLWPAAGDAVVVAGVTRTDYPGSLATVTVDGEITVSAGRTGFKVTSPDGGRATSGRPAGCTAGPSAMSSEIEVADLATGQVVLHVAEPETGYYAYAWSPNGSELLYREQPYDASGACLPTGPWRLLYADGTSDLADLEGVFTRWFGDELVELVCDKPDDRYPDAVLLNRGLEVRKACGAGPEPEAELRLNGLLVERLFEVRVLGFR